MNQICKNLLSNKADTMLANFFSNNIANLSVSIQSGINSKKIICWSCPYLVSGICLDISDNTANASSVKL